MEEVAKVFVKVNGRMRDVLTSLDADPCYSSFKPLPQRVSDVDDKVAEIKHNGWLGAYGHFMSMFLHASQEKIRQVTQNCVDHIIEQIDADSSLSDNQKVQEKNMLLHNRKSGMWTDDVLSFGDGYRDLMKTDWS
jgi:hypothetical protein